MSRWGRGGRSQGLTVPLDSLFKENANRPSAARSAGTVGKWGITSFTTIRNSAYGLTPGSTISPYVNPKRPKHDQISSTKCTSTSDTFTFDNPNANNSLQNKNTANIQTAKPKKFFKSRNLVPSTTEVKPDRVNEKISNYSKKEVKTNRKETETFTTKKLSTKSSVKQDIPKLKISLDKTKNSKTKFFSSKALTFEKPVVKTHLSPNKRYLSRNRNKVVNYSERSSLSPPPVAVIREATPPPLVASALLSPQRSMPDHPPIVLRISKGTSRLVSTDSESGNISPLHLINTISIPAPSSPRTADLLATLANSPPRVLESIRLTIRTADIKTYPNRTERNHKRRDSNNTEGKHKEPKIGGSSSRAARASRRNLQRDNLPDGQEDYPINRGLSPLPGSDNYDLYRTLASPADDSVNPMVEGRIVCDSASNDYGEANVISTVPEISSYERNSEATETAHHSELQSNELTSQADELFLSNSPEYNSPTSSNIPNIIEDVVRVTANNGNGNIPIVQSARHASKSYSRKRKAPLVEMPQTASQTSNSSFIYSEELHDQLCNSPVETNNISHTDQEQCENPKVLSSYNVTQSDQDKGENYVQNQWYDDNSESSQEKTLEETNNYCSDMKISTESEAQETKKAEDKPCVKLLISKKKGSIFKSRALVNDGSSSSSKKRHVYRHKCWLFDEQKPTITTENKINMESFDFDKFDTPQGGLTRVPRVQADFDSNDDMADTVTSVMCPKDVKGYYTVVRNVKKAHQIQEIGETQELNDDVEYILDALQDNNPMSTRCLSAITLASKCMTPAFRMHVRAHSTVTKFFRALHDASKDQSLGLCTATVMFALSQDQLNMDVDRDSLELMLNLLESDVSHQHALDDCGLSSTQLYKNKQKVRELCEDIKNQGKAVHLNLDNITVGQLAMETLLSLTSKRAGEWFKEELRELGGIDHIVKTICECYRQVSEFVSDWTDALLDKLRKIERCLRVLENVTQLNEENQTYLLNFDNGKVVDTLVRLFKLCDREISLFPTTGDDKEGTGVVIRETLMPTLKVLINLTHSFKNKSVGSLEVGQRSGVIETSLHLLLQAPHYIPQQKNFELSILALLLLINLIQDNLANRKLLAYAKVPSEHESIFPSDKSAIQALTEYFYQREQLARLEEQTTDAILDGKKEAASEEVKKPKSHEEFIEETVTKLLQKAGSHMEHTMIASYVVLLLGFTITDCPEHEDILTSLLPDNSYSTMIQVLNKYYKFMNLTASGESSMVYHIKQTGEVLKYLESRQKFLEAPVILNHPDIIREPSNDYPSWREDQVKDTSLDTSFDSSNC